MPEACTPKEIAERVENAGVAKASLFFVQSAVLGMLAGLFIGLGALYFVLVISDHSLPFAVARVLGGVVFSVGLLLVLVAGAELFTGNNLLAMAWAAGRLRTSEVLRNWIVVWTANLLGAVILASVVVISKHPDMNQGAVGQEYLKIAAAKVALPFGVAF